MLKKVCSFLALLVAFSLAAEPRVSVLYFDNTAGEEKHAFINKALADLLISDLAAVKGITLVERENLEKVMKELALGLCGVVDEETSPKVGNILGAQYLITGSYLVVRRTLAVQYKLIEVESGTIAASGSVEGEIGNILKVEDSLAFALMASLKKLFPGVILPSAKKARAAVPIEKVNDFGRALDFSDKGDYQKAKDILKSIVTETPDFARVKQELSDLEKRIARYDKKREELLTQMTQGPITYQSFIQLSTSYSSSMRYSKLLDLCMSIRDKPPQAPDGALVSTAQQVDFYIVMALYMLKRWDRLVPEAEHFVKTYPASMYYGTVKTYLTQGINEVKNLDAKTQRAHAKAREYTDKVLSSSEPQRSLLWFQAASTYSAEGLYSEALKHYQKADVKSLGKNGVTADLLLFCIFTCFYHLQDRAEAEKIYKTVEALYPQSEYLQGMQSMMHAFAE